MAITFRERGVWGWVMTDDLTHRYAVFDLISKKPETYRVITWDDTQMNFHSLEEAKTWASIALRT